MKNQHFRSSVFAAFSFKKLFSVVLSTGFPCWNLCLFGGRDLPLSDPFLEWCFMVWAPFWLPKPSRRPSRTHPKKTSKFDAYVYWFWTVLATPWSTLNCLKTTWMHPVGTHVFAPKAILSQSGLPGWNFSRLWLQKRQIRKPCSCIFDIFLDFLSGGGL